MFFQYSLFFYVLHLVSLKMSGEEEEGTAFLPKARKTGICTSVKGSDGVEGPKREGENVPDEPEETKELASHGNFDVEIGENSMKKCFHPKY